MKYPSFDSSRTQDRDSNNLVSGKVLSTVGVIILSAGLVTNAAAHKYHEIERTGIAVRSNPIDYFAVPLAIAALNIETSIHNAAAPDFPPKQ